MAPPKPSQAGKFKPRKPKRRTEATPIAVPSSTAGAPAPAASAAAPGRGRGGRGNDRGGGGRGRGGRGRGRGGRSSVQMGQAFFTGTPAASTAARRVNPSSTSTTTNKTTSQTSSKKANTIKSRMGGSAGGGGEAEEIVGRLDQAVGSSSSGRPSSVPSSNVEREDYDDYGGDDGAAAASNARGATVGDDCLYDSDSSREEQRHGRQNNHRSAHGLPQPVVLPIGHSPQWPRGIGDGPVIPYYPDANVERPPSHLPPVPPTASDNGTHITPPSPLVSPHNARALQKEAEGWFLVQLPTRLPPLQPPQNNANNNNNNNNTALKTEEPHDGHADMDGGNAQTTNTTNAIDNDDDMDTKPVAVPAVQGQLFDNLLLNHATNNNNMTGRIGKLIVYKSGKTILQLDSAGAGAGNADAQKPVRLLVHEGMTCGFAQQAVAISNATATGNHDVMDNTNDYVPLGHVHKTMVVTPDISGSGQQ